MTLLFLDFFPARRKFNIHHIFSTNPEIKIGQRYRKLLNGTGYFSFDVASARVKALANQLMSVVLVIFITAKLADGRSEIRTIGKAAGQRVWPVINYPEESVGSTKAA